MTDPDPSKKMQLSLTPVTKGFGHIADDNYGAAVVKAAQGGDQTQAWFDAQNQTSDFWGWLANHSDSGENPFAPGVDPAGNPIQMASNGNIDMRNGVFYRDAGALAAGAGDDPPIVGLATVQTHNTTSDLSRTISFGLGLVGIPAGAALTKKLFGDLLTPVYQNFKTWVTKTARQFQEASEDESPELDPEAEEEEPLSDATAEVGEVTGEAAEEVSYVAIDWGSVALEAAGLGVVAAIPLIVNYLGHKMVHTVEIHNLTDIDFTWSVLSQVHGQPSVMPKDDAKVIPKMDYNVDSWGDRTTVKVAYSAEFQFINSTDLGSIGYVLGLTPAGGGQAAKAVVSIPWAGNNTIWVGQSDDDADTIYADHSTPDGRLSVTASFGSYQVTWSITKLSGKTGDAYFYGVLGVIEPL